MKAKPRFICNWPNPPQLDGRRTFQGKPQLSRRDREILAQAQEHGVLVAYGRGETQFICNGSRLPRLAVLRLVPSCIS